MFRVQPIDDVEGILLLNQKEKTEKMSAGVFANGRIDQKSIVQCFYQRSRVYLIEQTNLDLETGWSHF